MELVRRVMNWEKVIITDNWFASIPFSVFFLKDDPFLFMKRDKSSNKDL